VWACVFQAKVLKRGSKSGDGVLIPSMVITVHTPVAIYIRAVIPRLMDSHLNFKYQAGDLIEMQYKPAEGSLLFRMGH
jgi:hypothetical protein